MRNNGCKTEKAIENSNDFGKNGNLKIKITKTRSKDVPAPGKLAVILLLIPVVPHVLHVLVVLHHVQQLGHHLDVVIAVQLDVVLRHHLDLSTDEGVALALQSGFLRTIVEATKKS